MRTDESYMSLALELAREAAKLGEVPVGAVAVWDGEVVGTGFNRRETGKNALAHAEPKAGCFGSVSDFAALPFNHRPAVAGGVLAEACAAELSAFFQRLRSCR